MAMLTFQGRLRSVAEWMVRYLAKLEWLRWFYFKISKRKDTRGH